MPNKTNLKMVVKVVKGVFSEPYGNLIVSPNFC